MSLPDEQWREKRDGDNDSANYGFVAPLAIAETDPQNLPGTRSLRSRAKLVLFISTALLFLWFWALGKHQPGILPTRLPAEDSFVPWPIDVDDTHAKPRRPRLLNGKAAEKIFLDVPNNESAVAISRRFAGKPHMAGTPGDRATAIDFLRLLQKELDIPSSIFESDFVFDAGSHNSRNATLGITERNVPTAWIDTYYPMMNSPLDRSVEIFGEDEKNIAWKAILEEVAEDELDPDAGKYAEAVPVFHGLSRGGEVTGKLVYVNYGRKEDYDKLEAAGVNFTGTIAIARYGGNFRGLKVKGAQERGAVGCLIYSDPRDDGSVRGDNGYASYPYGPARNPTSVQRGSVQFISQYPGDPTTPGYPSYENSTRIPGENIPRIPSLPISWITAQKLLQEIEEGGQNRTVKLVNHVDDKVTPIWNTMAVIPGHIKDEVVIVGNHRDAWILGATDPTSGTVSTYEVVRGLGVLLKKGWKPLRTIVIASWDAEEYGLIGSTEWGEDFAEWIDKYVVAYLNLDSSVSGSRFRPSASPSLAHLVRDVARDIPHPTIPGRTLWQARLDSGPMFGLVDEEAMHVWEEQWGMPLLEAGDFSPADSLGTAVKGGKKADITGELTRGASIGVGTLGSGSDYTVFLQRIGVASSNGGFASTLSDPVYHYHSVFDSEAWQERYGDPGFHRHVAIAKHFGLQLLRIADAIILPLNTTQYAYELDTYLNKVEDIAEKQGLDTDFSALRSSIMNIQIESVALDEEKAAAEEHLKKLTQKWWRGFHGHHKRWWCKVPKPLRKLACWHRLKSGKKCSCDTKVNDEIPAHEPPKNLGMSGRVKPRIGRYPAWFEEQKDRSCNSGERSLHHHHHWPARPELIKELISAVKRVRLANSKLVAFERGFIHEGGIIGREWYRHLCVAPGKWLGYGATTFPGVTEALTFDKNVTLAQTEAKRLGKLIDDLVNEIHI
ncbi:hypothetical protein EW145_g6362 [Phellinidium pouzarii]|uniref:Zn-dependent exopeptidase n=1 Tax=Phellinidium pouzarii TaxID=167371 RepID=A0A4S4KWU6_9AGAM|nr:hypothetical protein EW145_g6362 [Phellinidium pouzarii]